MSTKHPARTDRAHSGRLELSEITPRDVRLTGSGIAVIAVAIALVVAAIASAIVLSVAYTQSEERRQLREREKRGSEAQVVDLGRRRGDRRERFVTYSFEVGGRSYTGTAQPRDRDWRTLSKGARLSIEYLPSHPELNWIVGYEPGDFPFWMIPLVSISLLVSAALTGRSVRREWTLLSEGRVAQARVTAHKRTQTDKRRGYRVSCEFQDLSGATRTAQFDTGKMPPAIGALVAIVYHRDNPRWNATYPLRLVRPVRTPTSFEGIRRSTNPRNSAIHG
jgi:hypothetical protein